MTAKIPEADWEKFRGLCEVILERFCDQILQEVAKLAADDSASSYERYLKIHELIEERNQQLAYLFDNPRRSQMIGQLGGMQTMGLLEADELAEFTSETRDRIALFVKS
ncbi:MAG: peptide ABC transporter substrate-binding protein [Spirulinaceae cyanobacterium]